MKVKDTTRKIYRSLKHGGGFLVSEPAMHVPKADFMKHITPARTAGFIEKAISSVFHCRSVIFE